MRRRRRRQRLWQKQPPQRQEHATIGSSKLKSIRRQRRQNMLLIISTFFLSPEETTTLKEITRKKYPWDWVGRESSARVSGVDNREPRTELKWQEIQPRNGAGLHRTGWKANYGQLLSTDVVSCPGAKMPNWKDRTQEHEEEPPLSDLQVC